MSLLDKTNLLITPNAVKAGKLFSVIPSNGSRDCTVIRNTTGSRRNSLGNIVSASANVPRLTYLSSGAGPFLLDEEQRTNLILYSTDLSDASWSKFTTVVTFNQGISPDGLNNAVKVVRGGGSDFLVQTYNNANVLNHARSIYAKTVTGTGTARLLSFNGNTNNLFNITNEWQRFELNNYIGTGGSVFYAVDFRGSGVTLSEILIWQPQAEVGVAASSSIFTQGAAVTRNADVITATPPAGTVKITTTFSNNTTQVLTTIPATFTIPQGLIKQVLMQNSL